MRTFCSDRKAVQGISFARCLVHDWRVPLVRTSECGQSVTRGSVGCTWRRAPDGSMATRWEYQIYWLVSRPPSRVGCVLRAAQGTCGTRGGTHHSCGMILWVATKHVRTRLRCSPKTPVEPLIILYIVPQSAYNICGRCLKPFSAKSLSSVNEQLKPAQSKRLDANLR
jgi:hypothetical protein